MALTADYIEKHKTNIQTPDSFGRAVIAMIMEEAKKKTTGTESRLSINIEFEVEEVPTASCFKIKISDWFSIHIF